MKPTTPLGPNFMGWDKTRVIVQNTILALKPELVFTRAGELEKGPFTFRTHGAEGSKGFPPTTVLYNGETVYYAGEYDRRVDRNFLALMPWGWKADLVKVYQEAKKAGPFPDAPLMPVVIEPPPQRTNVVPTPAPRPTAAARRLSNSESGPTSSTTGQTTMLTAAVIALSCNDATAAPAPAPEPSPPPPPTFSSGGGGDFSGGGSDGGSGGFIVNGLHLPAAGRPQAGRMAQERAGSHKFRRHGPL